MFFQTVCWTTLSLQFHNGITCGGHADGNVARLLVAGDGETITCKELRALEGDVDGESCVRGFGTWIEHHQHYLVASSTGVDEGIRVLSLGRRIEGHELSIVGQGGLAVMQGDETARLVEQRVGILLLCSDIGCIGRWVDGQIEFAGVSCRESKVLVLTPLHRRAGTIAGLVGSLYLRPTRRQLAHAYLVAVIQERYARHGEAEGIDNLPSLTPFKMRQLSFWNRSL